MAVTHRLAALASLSALLALAAACSSPTPTPTATPAPTPTPTSAPTATPTATPEVSVDEFTITESTTGADVMALLSESELACVSTEMDPETAQALLSAPLIENLDLLDAFPTECLETGKATVLSIAMLEAQTPGGLSAETKACLSTLYAESPWMLGSEQVEEITPEFAASVLRYYLCFSDEEAAAVPADEEMPFKPSELRCVVRELGGVEKFAAFLDGGPQDFSLTDDFMAAAYTCGTNLGLGESDDRSAARPPSSLSGLTITKETTGHDLMAALSESEAECVRTSQSAWTAGTFIDAPLIESITLYGAGYFPFTCLTPGSMADLGIGVVSAQAGGLSSETLSCLDDYFAGFPSIPEPEGTIWKQHGPFTMNFVFCLSDEESDAQPDEGGGALAFKPSILWCILNEPWGVDGLLALMSANEESPPDPHALHALEALAAAGAACGG